MRLAIAFLREKRGITIKVMLRNTTKSRGVFPVIVALLLAAVLMPTATVQAQIAKVSIPDATIGYGDTVTLPINITGVTSLGTATIWLSYDKAVVTVDGVADGDIGTVTYAIYNDDGVTKMTWFSVYGKTGDYVFAYITLRAIGNPNDTSPLGLDIKEFEDTAFNSTNRIAANGTFTISGAPPIESTIAFSPESFAFTAIEDRTNPDNQTLEIWNSGGGTLDWSVSKDADWLSLSPLSDSSTGEHNTATVSADISGMSDGDYSATITISATGAANSPQTVPVSLHISSTIIYYTLSVTYEPTEGGSLALDPTQPAEGYPAGTAVQLTATASGGYAFGSWSGELSGSSNPASIMLDDNKEVTANFVEFSAPANVDVVAVGPNVENIDVAAKPVGEVDTTNMPSGYSTQAVYMVESTGTGRFTLKFTGIADAPNIVIHKVTGSEWIQLAATGIGVTLEVTIPAGKSPIVFSTPSGPLPGVSGTANTPNKLIVLTPWIVLAVVIIACITIAIRRRRAWK